MVTVYFRAHGAENLTYGDFIIVQSVWGVTQGTIFPLSGFIIRLIGPRVAMFGGCVIFSLGTALTYFTIKTSSLTLVAFTYGFISAFGQGIALIPTMTIGMRWFPKRKGMAMGIVVGGFGGGAFIFNQIQTAILNPDNVAIDESSKYFTDPTLLNRVPTLMLYLTAIYLTVQMIACLLVTEPNIPCNESTSDFQQLDNENETKDKESKRAKMNSISPMEALKTREFYILWLTRFSVVLITQSIAGFYKAFGQTFISDDHFLSLVGAICSIFNCSGRLVYGTIMDKTTYRTAMLIETSLLAIFMATLVTTTYGGKIMFAIWVWMIFLTFPGTYSTQPAVTTQTFGHKHGGTIYGFLFTSDIVNNLLVGFLSKSILETWDWLGLFLILASFALFGTGITLLFPPNPSPKFIREKSKRNQNDDDIGVRNDEDKKFTNGDNCNI